MLLGSFTFAPDFGPYKTIPIEGWTVKVNQAELDDSTWKSEQAELQDQLFRIARVVPDGPLAKLRMITIWVQKDDPTTPCAAYHPGKKWLIDKGTDPAMVHGVELANAKNFISWTYEQPWMVLHELAHAYNDRFLPGGFANKEIKAAYEAMMASGKYDHVLHWDGAVVKAYAETNQMEYFSECTEAYFGRNDFYPFNNAELKTFDPTSFNLMESIWGNSVKRP